MSVASSTRETRRDPLVVRPQEACGMLAIGLTRLYELSTRASSNPIGTVDHGGSPSPRSAHTSTGR
jgi:hypothetical protein